MLVIMKKEIHPQNFYKGVEFKMKKHSTKTKTKNLNIRTQNPGTSYKSTAANVTLLP